MRNYQQITILLCCLVILIFSSGVYSQKLINIQPKQGDMTPILRQALEHISDKEVKIVFAKGKYTFYPDYAKQQYSYITNHGNGLKNIIFLLENFDSVEIEGNRSEFIFHGQIAPFQFRNCKKVSVKDLTLNWDIPFLFQGEVVAVDSVQGWRNIRPFKDGYSWDLKNDQLHFPNIDGFSFLEMGSTLAFDPVHKRVSHGTWDISSNPRWVEKRSNGILRFHEFLKHYPPIGSILNSKGEKEQNRYAPAFQVVKSNDVLFENIVVHHALGMGFLFERTEDITLKDSGVYVRKELDRVVSTIADATHFANCKGDILIENSTFMHMMDDGTNVHGTYVEVDQLIKDYSVRVALKHFEQLGFQFADKGDVLWFIHKPNPGRTEENEVTAVVYINDRYADITFRNKLTSNLAVGDILENKTWNPTFTMRGCTVKDHRARNIVLKTPKKILIENNHFSSMMSSIFFRGESFYWFESGAVEDVLIQNNNFQYCAYSGMEHAVLKISPRLGADFDATEIYDRNIRFKDNTIQTFDNQIVWGNRVDGLLISGNTIKHVPDAPALYPSAPMFDFMNCKNVEISKNSYEVSNTHLFHYDQELKKTIKVKGNKGFNIKK